jgi:hypothetical protein
MNKERRTGKPAVPGDLRDILTMDQKLALRELETFGWKILFVRRPLFQQPRVIMHNPDTGNHSVIEADGTVDHNPLSAYIRQDDR